MKNGILHRIGFVDLDPEQPAGETPAAGENAPMQLYVGNTNILPGGIWASADGAIWERDDFASDHYVKYENNILTLKNVAILGEFNASGNTSGAGIHAVGQLKQSLCLTIELIGNNSVSGFSGIVVAANHSSGRDAVLAIRGTGSLTAEGTGVVDGGIVIRASDGTACLTIENAQVKATGGTSGAGVLLEGANNDGTELAVNVSGGSLTASGSDSYGGISYYCGANRVAGHARLKVSSSARVSAVSGIKAVRAALQVPEEGDGGGIVFDGKEGTVYGNVTLYEKLTIKAGETLQISSGASLNTDGWPIVVERGGKLEGYMTGGAGWKVSGVTLWQNSLRLKQNGIAELQADPDPALANGSVIWSSFPNGVVQIFQNPTDGTKASIKPMKEGGTTVTVAAEGGKKIALCEIIVRAVENRQKEITTAAPENCPGDTGIRAFFHRRKEKKK